MKRLAIAAVSIVVVVAAGCGSSSSTATKAVSTTTIDFAREYAMGNWYKANAHAVTDYVNFLDSIASQRSDGDPAYTCFRKEPWPAWALDPVPDMKIQNELSDAITRGGQLFRHCQAGYGGIGNPDDDLTYSDLQHAADAIRKPLNEIRAESGS